MYLVRYPRHIKTYRHGFWFQEPLYSIVMNSDLQTLFLPRLNNIHGDKTCFVYRKDAALFCKKMQTN